MVIIRSSINKQLWQLYTIITLKVPYNINKINFTIDASELKEKSNKVECILLDGYSGNSFGEKLTFTVG